MEVTHTNNIKQSATDYMKSIGKSLLNGAADLLSNSDFLSRTIGMNTSYDDVMFLVQSLGRKPVSLLGKDYLFIFDHVRRNYRAGTDESNMSFSDNDYCHKFTFYKERPTVRFANPYYDNMNLLDRWVADMRFERTSSEATMANGTLFTYAESDDDTTNNKILEPHYANTGIRFGGTSSYPIGISTCDLIAKTNANFNHGKYRTLISRFHTNSDDSKVGDDITQTGISRKYGISHGRNLLKVNPDESYGYDNPYCRVWTNHHQYSRLADAIRPFGETKGYEELESLETVGDFDSVGFRTTGSSELGFPRASTRLDRYGVLNRNGMVNIAPTAKIVDYFGEKSEDEDKVSVKKCMFSIENLAWKTDNITPNEYDQWGLSPEQKGPLGGRIMWFPPYDLSFSEDVQVNWNQNQFIGRGEKVYTYTDTERSGNLSFTLLIDHPSILDYWNGQTRNGQKNQGLDLDDGNTGGVDNLKNQENTLLRFFAGCEVLSAKPQEYWYRDKKEKKSQKENTVPEVKTDPPEEEVHPPTIEKKIIHCVLYYPNNYSGVNDGGVVNPIHYLMNGIGTQKYVDLKNNTVDIPTTIDTGVSSNGYKGGYEVRDDSKGVSVVTEPLDTDYETIKKSYADTVSNERKAQYITDKNGNKISAWYDVQAYNLAKIVGSEALSLSAAKTDANLKKSPYEWYRRRWYYRVDNAYENQRLSTKESYLDFESKGLNGKAGYEAVKSKATIAKAFGLNVEDENTTLISFADLFVALEGEKAKNILTGCYDDKNVAIVKDIKENKDNRYNITSIRFEGHASYQGTSANNNTLSDNRALTLKKWMQKMGFPNVESASATTKTQSKESNIDKGENNSLATKLWRSASVIIEYDESQVVDASSAESEMFEEKNGEIVQQTVKMEIPNGMESQGSLNMFSSQSRFFMHQNLTPGPDIKPIEGLSIAQLTGVDMRPSWEQTNQVSASMAAVAEKAQAQYEDEMSKHTGTVERYDNEGEFFELLSEKDPFLHNLITNKIRYFDPAYHSISPEGFNARLTFLHQCTRQGSTVGASDGGPNTAYNLAFGRPPVCVLRLGDFYYTKIIINSISIQYENAQWDLNPEGIGVMPMFAKVTMNFKFLGGSDLGGPISRLQNAVSFNYYANTSVYDNRSEMVEYSSDKSGKEVKFKPYSYPNMLHNGLPRKLTGSYSDEGGAGWVSGVDANGNGEFNDPTNMIGKSAG